MPVDPTAWVAPSAVLSGEVTIGAHSRVLHGAVHSGCALPAAGWVRIGWVAVGDPARIYPPGESQTIRDGLSEVGGCMQYVFGVDAGADRGAQMRAAMEKYTRGLAKLYR